MPSRDYVIEHTSTSIQLLVPSNRAANIPAIFLPLSLIERGISSVWRHGERNVYPSVAHPLRKLPYYNLDRYYVAPRPSVRTNYPYSISPPLFTLLSHYFLVSGCPGLFLSPRWPFFDRTPPEGGVVARRRSRGFPREWRVPPIWRRLQCINSNTAQWHKFTNGFTAPPLISFSLTTFSWKRTYFVRYLRVGACGNSCWPTMLLSPYDVVWYTNSFGHGTS